MSTIIELIITFVLYFLAFLVISLFILYIENRKLDKYISNYFRKIDESRAARSQSQDEVSAQVDDIHESIDELDKSFDEIGESMDEMDESMDEISESLDEIGESLDKMDESMDRLIEFKRIMRDYSNLKIKRIEARENFCESQFWDEKNIH